MCRIKLTDSDTVSFPITGDVQVPEIAKLQAVIVPLTGPARSKVGVPVTEVLRK